MPALEPGFNKATSDNLPNVDDKMLALFFSSPSFSNPETRNVKVLRSADAVYSDNAIGWVQVKDENNRCEVRALITPEHKITSTSYKLHCIIDETDDVIIKAKCDSCRAQNDGCKHAVAFVTWLYRKANEPSVTSVECYWNRAVLSKVGGKDSFSFISDSKAQREIPTKAQVTKEKTKACFNEVCELFKNQKQTKDMLLVKSLTLKDSLSIHHLLMRFKREIDPNDRTSGKFLEFCSNIMTDTECTKMYKQTVGQSDSSLWQDLRYARVTASKIYEVARCKTPDGSLVNGILGVVKVPETAAILRGKVLEKKVLQIVSAKYGRKINRAGFMMKKEHPCFGASPDGIMGEYIVEVKCPISQDTFKTYFQGSGKPAKKHKGQLALQMFMCNKTKALFCVAHPDFEKSGGVKILELTQNMNFLRDIMRNAQKFWSENVFSLLHDNI